jgi:hypothetical protein
MDNDPRPGRAMSSQLIEQWHIFFGHQVVETPPLGQRCTLPGLDVTRLQQRHHNPKVLRL